MTLHTYRTSDNRRMTVKVTTKTTYTVPPPPSDELPADLKPLFLRLHELDAGQLWDLTQLRAAYIQQIRDEQKSSDGLWDKSNEKVHPNRA